MLTTAFMLLYGDYPALHLKVLPKFFMYAPEDKVSIRLWLNVVCPETFAWLATHRRRNLIIYLSDQNVPKYKVMRRIFHDPAHPIRTDWITWFDDDAIIVRPDWFDKTVEFITQKSPNVYFFGQERRKGHQPGIKSFIEKATWYKGRKLQRILGENNRYRGPGIVFVQGSYWWLKTCTMREINWPDERLNHNGGDTLLSEAIWQQRIPQHEFYYGIMPNNAGRRGLSENPAGFRYRHRTATDGKAPTMIGKMAEYYPIIQAHGLKYQEDGSDLVIIPASEASVRSNTKVVQRGNKIPARARRELKLRQG